MSGLESDPRQGGMRLLQYPLHQRRDKRPRFDYMSRMIHLTATYWYFSSSLAAGGLRSI